MLTNSELNQIKNFLALYGKKDSQLSQVTSVENADYIVIIHDSKNVTITVELLKRAVLEGIITDEEFNDLWDETPTEGSRKAVRSNGVWHAINDDNVIDTNQIKNNAITTDKIKAGEVKTGNIADKNVTEAKLSDDINNALSKFTNSIKVNNATSVSMEIVNDTLPTVTISKENILEFFGDRASIDVTSYVTENITKNAIATEDTIVGNTWTIETGGSTPNARLGAHTITYTSTYNGVTPSGKTATVNMYLKKYFGYSADQPTVTSLPTSDARATVSCTVTLAPISTTEEYKWRYIWLAVPDNMSITKVIQTSTGYELQLHEFSSNVKYTTTTRTIGGNTYTYKLYRSELRADCTLGTTLQIS